MVVILTQRVGAYRFIESLNLGVNELILLSFDIEEFDVPAVEHGMDFSFDEQMQISIKGTKRVLTMLADTSVKATFFCTANFADNAPEIVQKIVSEGHELASHGYYHSTFEDGDYLKSKQKLESIGQCDVKGFRMARMMPVSYIHINEAGYQYDSSINPTFIPGRYNNLSLPKKLFRNEHTIVFPSSVSPFIRFPLFWLSFHNLPLRLYLFFADSALKADGYLNIYFHPWEFVSLNDPKYGLPFYFKNKSGQRMIDELGYLIARYRKKGKKFGTINEFLDSRDIRIKN